MDTISCQTYDQTKFHMVRGIDNAFDHYEIVFCHISGTIFSVKNSLLSQEITFITDSQVETFCFPHFNRWQIWFSGGNDNAFDHYEIVFCHISGTIFSVKNSLLSQEITFITDSQVETFCFPHFNRWQIWFSGGKFATCYC